MNRLETVEAFGTLFLIALALTTAFPWPVSSPAQAAAAPAASQALTQFTGTLCRTQGNVPFSVDLGTLKTCWSTTQVSWADNWTPQTNFTWIRPQLFSHILTVTTFQNSSTVDVRHTASFLGRTATIDVYWTSLPTYGYQITIAWVITGALVAWPLTIPFGANRGLAWNSTAFACSTHLCFNWQKDASLGTWNNSTKTLTFTIQGSGSIDPIAVDTSGSCAHAGTTNTCTTATITTTGRNDLLLMFIWTTNPTPDCEAQTETSSPAMTWRERNNIGAPNGGFGSEFCEYYAQWDSVGAFTVTCVQATNGKGGCFIIAISDAMIKPPSFDTGLCVNQRTLVTTTTTTINACPLTSYNKRDLLIGAIAVQAATPTITAGSGFTLVGCRQSQLLSICVEDQLVSSAQTNTQATWVDVTSSGNTAWFLSDTVEEFKPDIVQFATPCSFTTTQHPTCAFSNNVVAGDSVLVVGAATSQLASIASVTDSQGLTYSKIVAKATSAGSDIEGWWACNVGTSAADTITVNWDSSRSGGIMLYELTPSDAACTVRSSSGSGSGTSLTVSSYTPLNASLVIGTATEGAASVGMNPGTGYLHDGAFVSPIFGEAEHATNNGTAETTPITLVSSSPWNEISMSFVRPTPNAFITAPCATTTLIPQTNTALFSTTVSSTQPLTLSSTESETSTVSQTTTTSPAYTTTETESYTLSTTSTRTTSQSKVTTTITIPITLSTSVTETESGTITVTVAQTTTISETETPVEQTTFSQTIPVTLGTTSSTTQSLTLSCTGVSASTTVTTGSGGADPPNFDWLLLIPVFFVVALLLVRKVS